MMRRMVSFSSSWSSCGTGPLRRLYSSRNSLSRDSFPSSGGIGPVSWFRLRSSDTSWLNRPSAGGMRPFKPELASSSLVTRSSEPPMVTPHQDLMWTCSLQLSRASPARMSLLASRSAQSARKPD